MLNVIRKEHLLELNLESGQVMLNGLKDLEKKYPEMIQAPRGLGTFCAVDCPTIELR